MNTYLKDGNAGKQIYAIDWSESPLGSLDIWPTVLTNVVNLILNSSNPMFVVWGSENNMLYNDSFSEIFGNNNNNLEQGMSVDKVYVFEERILSHIEEAYKGKVIHLEDRITFDFAAPKKIDFSFLPVFVENNEVGGVTCSCAFAKSPSKEELKDSLDLAEKTINTVREPMLVLSHNLRVNKANTAFCNSFKTNQNETVGKLVYELGNGQWNIPRLKVLLENVLSENESFENFEISHHFEHIGKKTMLLNARRIDHQQLILLAIEDITERNNAHNQLLESEAKYKSLFNSIDEGFCIVEMIFDENQNPVDYKFLEVNPAFEKQTGLKNAKGKRMLDLVPNHEKHWFEIYGDIAKTGKPRRFIQEAKPLIGGWYEVYAFPLSSQGNTVAIVFNDITNRKNAEESLRRSQEHLRLILESATDYAIFTMDLDKNITEWNVGAENLLGYSEREIIGKKGDIIFIPEERDREPEQELKLARENGSAENERWHLRKDGSRFWGSGLTMPLKDKNGRLRGFLKIMKDDTERVKMMHELEEARSRELKLIRSENQRKDEFMNIASHELKTPLTSLKAYIQLLGESLETMDKTTLHQFLGKIDVSVERLNRLISDLLEVSRINSGKIQSNFSEFNFSEIVKESVEMAQHQSSTHTIRFEGHDRLIMTGDSNRLHQVLDNLISNAIKYSPQGGEIRVNVAGESETIHVSVSDNGIGIPEEQLQEVFKPYKRADMKYKISGLGLGLFICKEIISDHNGNIWAESEPDKGSVFHFRIPKTSLPPVL